MFNQLRASLYDLFGYLFPGVVLFAALCIGLTWAWRDEALFEIGAIGKTPVAVAVLGISYILGHLVQAAGNALPVLRTPPDDLLLADPTVPRELVTLATERVSQISGADASVLPPREVLSLLDEYVKMRGKAIEREMFVYREGFYRGMTIASALLGIVLALQSSAGAVRFAGITTKPLALSQAELAAIGGLSLVAAYGFFERMRRFGRYRVKSGLYGFLMLKSPEVDRNVVR